MNKINYNNANTCMYCGEIVPEGRQICVKCEYKYNHKLSDLIEDEEDSDWEDELYND